MQESMYLTFREAGFLLSLILKLVEYNVRVISHRTNTSGIS